MSVPVTSTTDLTTSLERVLAESDRPVSLATLKKKFLRAGDTLDNSIEAAVRNGNVWRWPAYRGSSRYWHRDPVAVAREKIEEVAASLALSPADLIKKARQGLPGYPESKLKTLVREMIAGKELRTYPGIGPERSRIGATGVPQSYINAVNEFVAKKLKAAGIGDPVEQPTPSAPDLKQRVLDALLAIEPNAGLPVSARRLRQHELLRDVLKADFDRAVLGLRSDRRVSLDRHDDAYNLSAEERDQLIEENGTYYVAASLRTE